MQVIAGKIEKPSAILVVSAHWEQKIPTITSGTHPSLLYDYYGFPEEAYAIEYPCPGERDLAQKVQQALADADITARLDEERGFDHGLFVPLKIMYPEPTIPCIQLSIVRTLDPMEHIHIGRALQRLTHEKLLVIGSGFSFHNMKAFFAPETPELNAQNQSFESWLSDTCSNQRITEEERAKRLAQWEEAPFARYCHPREDHLLPLHVCYGLAGTYCSERFELTILNKRSSMYLWSATAEPDISGKNH
ncbi:dioxygenase [Desulfoluna limicola]|uniref:Dioxygenase n=1 Tax=Desulfoluna limicola TaxID=2810562 RepID=A0ABN6F226_9BACT|nr:class III extradiol ring-cleavage dioxygenase [Desulfoluna limicola]BCS95300.1 dioxygenase [Desulfoluna limicola]